MATLVRPSYSFNEKNYKDISYITVGNFFRFNFVFSKWLENDSKRWYQKVIQMTRKGDIVKKIPFRRDFSNTEAWTAKIQGSKVKIRKVHPKIYKINYFQNYREIFHLKLPNDYYIWTILIIFLKQCVFCVYFWK